MVNRMPVCLEMFIYQVHCLPLDLAVGGYGGVQCRPSRESVFGYQLAEGWCGVGNDCIYPYLLPDLIENCFIIVGHLVRPV